MENWLKGITSKAKKKIAGAVNTVGDWFTPDDNPEVRPGEFLREVPGATADIAKEIAKGALRVPFSAGEALVSLPMDTYNLATGKGKKVPIYEPEAIPGLGFLGPIESYQNQARREISQGEGGAKTFGKAAVNIALDEPLGVAFKPLGLAMGAFIKSGGGKAASEAIDAIVKAVDPKEIKGILEGFGVGKKAIDESADALAKATTREEVTSILTGASKEAAPKAPKVAKAAAETPKYNRTLNINDPGDLAEIERTFNKETADNFAKGDFSYGRYKNDKAKMEEFMRANIVDEPYKKPKLKTSAYKGPRTFYHGTSPESAALIREEGFRKGADLPEDAFRGGGYGYVQNSSSFSTDPLMASRFTGSGSRGSLVVADLADDAKVVSAKGIEDAAELEDYVDDLVKDGVDAVWIGGGEKELVVLNPSKVQYRGSKDFSVINAKEDLANVADEFKPKKKAPQKKEAVDVPRETDLPEGEDTMRSVGDILAGRGGTVPPAAAKAPRVPKENGAERSFVKRAGAEDPDMQQYLKPKYTPRSTAALADEADRIIADDFAKAEDMARNGTDDLSVAVASRMIDDLTVKARAAEGAAKDALYEKAAQIANDAGANLTEAGRAVQAASLLGRMTPEGMVRYAARQISKYNEKAGKRTLQNFLGSSKKIPNLSGEQAEDLVKRMEKINAMEDGVAKSKEIQKLQDSVREMIPSSLYDKIVTLWKAGLLTGLKTSGLNILANTSHAATEVLKDVPAALVDRITSMFTGKRTLAATTKGKKGISEGVAKGWDYFKTGYDERNVGAKLDYKKVNFGKSKFAKALQKYEETVFQTIGAEDQPFYYGAKARSLYSQAIAQAKNEGLKGKAAKDFIEKLVANPTDDMLKYAVIDAETSVFQNKTALGTAARAIQNLPGGQIVLPFGKTPAAVATQMINYTPVGIAKTIIENIGKGRFDQRLFSQGIGRGLTGTGALAIGMALYGNDMLNLSYPTSEKEREQWELEGRQPNSILIDGKWRNIGILGPLGMVLVIGGHMRNGIDETGSWAGGLAQAAGGAGSALTEQSFLKGINQAISAIQDPERSFGGFASSLSGSIVPTIVSDISRALDPYERRTESPIQRTISRIPIFRRSLEPKVDTLGNKVETPNLFEVMADPTRPGNPSSKEKDPVVDELRRLMDSGYPVTPTQLGNRVGYESLTPEQNTWMWEKGGQYTRDQIEEVMSRPSYQKYDDEIKAKLIDDAVQDAKVEARARVVMRALEGLSEPERKAKLAEMKDDKLLTQQVYNLYRSLSRN